MWVLAMLVSAQAADLSWRWDSPEPVRFHAEALISTPLGFPVYGAENIDARALQTGVALDTTCTGRPSGKVFAVSCRIDQVVLEGAAYQGEQDKLNGIYAEYIGLLGQATVEMEIRPDGHIRQLDVEGVQKKNDRWATMHENLRQIMRRTFAPLSLQLPKPGTDPSKGWKHKGVPLAFELISDSGTTGGMAYEYELAGNAGDTVVIHGFGRGNVATHDQLEAGGNAALNLVVSGQARFDPAAGTLAYSEVSVTGVASTSSMTVGPSQRYAYAGWVGRINNDSTVESLNGSPAPPPPANLPATEPPAAPPAAPPIDDDDDSEEADG